MLLRAVGGVELNIKGTEGNIWLASSVSLQAMGISYVGIYDYSAGGMELRIKQHS